MGEVRNDFIESFIGPNRRGIKKYKNLKKLFMTYSIPSNDCVDPYRLGGLLPCLDAGRLLGLLAGREAGLEAGLLDGRLPPVSIAM